MNEVMIFRAFNVVCLLFALIFPTAFAASVDGQALFEKRCAACHRLPDIHDPPPEGWLQSLKKMAPLAKLKRPQNDAVLAYLSSHAEQMAKAASREEDKVFFEENCGRCHALDHIFLGPLTDDSRRHVVNRMQIQNGTDLLADEDVDRMLKYLSGLTSAVEAPPALATATSPEEIFAARCLVCHSQESISIHLDPNHAMEMDWPHVVSRLHDEAPQWMTDAEVRQIVDYIESLRVPKNEG